MACIEGYRRAGKPAEQEASLVVGGCGPGPEGQDALKGTIEPVGGERSLRPEDVDLDAHRRLALEVDESATDHLLRLQGDRNLLPGRGVVYGLENHAVTGGGCDEARAGRREGGRGPLSRYLKTPLGVGLA